VQGFSTRIFDPADSAQALTTAAGVLARIQTQITHHLFAAREALHGTERQHEGQAHHRTHAGMGHQQLHFLSSLGLSGHCLIQLGDGGIQRSQQLSQILPSPVRPRQQPETLQFCLTASAPQLVASTQTLTQGQGVQLVLHGRPHPHQLIAMRQQLPQVAFPRRRCPNTGKASGRHQVHQVPGVTRIMLLPAYAHSANLGGIAHPQFMMELRQYPFEPVGRGGCFNPHDRPAGQAGIERPCLAVLVREAMLHHLSGLLIQHGNLLIARMQITSDNQHGSAPFLSGLGRFDPPSLPVQRSRRRYEISLKDARL
jgi:hypothetical protein